jgi:metal-responsive CopG/Arc/MetJ family transcriptional regulator
MPEPLMEQLKRVAESKGLATSDIIRRACDKYLEELKKSENPS